MKKIGTTPSREKSVSRGEKIRPLTTDERASFIILSFYMAVFCISTFVYWQSLVLQIMGMTAATAGLFLFVAAFFNTEAAERSHSVHPLRTYLYSVFTVLLVLFLIRFITGWIDSVTLSIAVAYGGLLIALIVFRKALVQVISASLVLIFLFITLNNYSDILVGNITFKDAMRQCGTLIFQVGPIQDLKNLFISGHYIGYLARIDYRDTDINILAIRTVIDSNDHEVRKTEAILNFVSNEIKYISDPNDGMEYAKDPHTTLLAGGGDCEDQTLLLCSMLESVGVKTYIAFTDSHVFALVRFEQNHPSLATPPYLWVNDGPCYALDAADPGALIGHTSANPQDVERVFDVRKKSPTPFYIDPQSD